MHRKSAVFVYKTLKTSVTLFVLNTYQIIELTLSFRRFSSLILSSIFFEFYNCLHDLKINFYHLFSYFTITVPERGFVCTIIKCLIQKRVKNETTREEL